jgi:hypothetical protein
VYFRWKDRKNGDISGGKQIGFIAQEVEKIVPEVVTNDGSRERFLSVAYANLTALLVEAMKELNTADKVRFKMILALSKKLEALRAEVSQLKKLNEMRQPKIETLFKGEGQLKNGKAMLELPESSENLAVFKDLTVHLSNIGGSDRLAIELQDGKQVKDGKFIIYSDNPDSCQAFNWEVKAAASH